MFRVFNGEGYPRADPAPHRVPGSGFTGHGSHRNRGTVHGIFVDSASRFRRPYGTREKSASVILGMVQHFVADMGVPQAFRTDNGAEYTNSTFFEYCNSLRIRRELTASYRPQQNGAVESGLSCPIKAGHATRIEVNKLFPYVHLERLKGVRDPDGSSLWMESVVWASERAAPRPRRTAGCFPHSRYSSGATHRCRFCRSASRRTIASRGRVR